VEEIDIAAMCLDVYETQDGLWNPDHGDVEVPPGWEFLASGDAFMTRRVKAGGRYWMAWLPRTRSRQHRRLVGLWAPSATIDEARVAAEQSATERAQKRVANARGRAAHEERYREDFASAVVAFLNFAPAHAALAQEIALGVAAHATVISSGRVGRSRQVPLEERAALAARAFIRHRYTDYEHSLDTATFDEDFDRSLDAGAIDDHLYRSLKRDAAISVDNFLDRHRTP
jgi:hypothetical protein